MSITELQYQVKQIELQYKEAIKARKVFWEVRKIVDQKRAIERALALKKNEASD